MIILFLFIFLIGHFPTKAIPIAEVINPRTSYGGWVTDMADMLKPDTENQLNQMISQLETENGSEIAVVTVPDTVPFPTPKAFTTKLFNTWGIGKAEKDNGVLVLVSKSDRRVEIEVGLGFPDILSNNQVQNIIDRQILPKFKAEDFDGGVLVGTKAIVTILQGNSLENSLEFLWFNSALFAFVKVMLWIILPLLVCIDSYRNLKRLTDVKSKIGRKSPRIWFAKFYSFLTARLVNRLAPTGYTRISKNDKKGIDEVDLMGIIIWFCVTFIGFFLIAALNGFLLFPFVISISCISTLMLWGSLYWCGTLGPYKAGENYFGSCFLLFAAIVSGLVFFQVFAIVTAPLMLLINFMFEPSLEMQGIAVFFIVTPLLLGIPLSKILGLLYGKSFSKYRCNQCNNHLNQISNSSLQSLLSKPQKVAQEIGSTEYQGWHCRSCKSYSLSPDTIHILARLKNQYDDQIWDLTQQLGSPSEKKKLFFEDCSVCDESTATCTSEILESPTYEKSGTRVVYTHCQCCERKEVKEKIIPKKVRTTSSSSTSINHYGTYDSGSKWVCKINCVIASDSEAISKCCDCFVSLRSTRNDKCTINFA
ncbi:MAG: TPM domain-containing protein [Cyanobacteria bacterium J06629_18]